MYDIMISMIFFQLRTPLEVQVAALLKGSDYVIKDQKQELTPAEQRALKAMDIQEVYFTRWLISTAIVLFFSLDTFKTVQLSIEDRMANIVDHDQTAPLLLIRI